MEPRVRRVFTEVGQINWLWDEIEILLWYVFDALLGVPWSYSYSIYFSQQNHRARREMLEALADRALRDQPTDAKKLALLVKRVGRAASRRNEIAHGVWHRQRIGRKIVLQRVPLKRHAKDTGSVRMTLNDLEAVHRQLATLYNDLFAFAVPLWHAKVKRLDEKML